ncbi:hypothetical protein TNIN_487391 [Trichonephila inaurata madagascariensis]|uniref:Uncharacterized protein n=1 Tax=Trichonephila inaurata madagascariensis TaxID=2747483 RepID=A0A8X6XW57_9ARAC|nr:hypothetical protein TNIN_487391 [Trichonephila inaurata madagascariensis]
MLTLLTRLITVPYVIEARFLLLMATSRFRLCVVALIRHSYRRNSQFRVQDFSTVTRMIKMYIMDSCIRLHYFWTPMILVVLAFFVLMCAVLDLMNPLYDSHGLAQLLESCSLNNTNGSTDSGLQKMSDVLRSHGVDILTVDKSSMQSDFYTLMILLLLGQAVSFHAVRFIWTLAKNDDSYYLANFIGSSTFKRLNMTLNIDSVIEKLVMQFGKPKMIVLLLISETICFFNVAVQSYITENPGVSIMARVFSLESSFNSNWTAECDYAMESHQVSKCSFRCHDFSNDLFRYDTTCHFTSNRIDQFLYKCLEIYFTVVLTITIIKVMGSAGMTSLYALVYLFPYTNWYKELKPYFTRLELIIYHFTPEKMSSLDSICLDLDSPDIGNTVKELKQKLAEENSIERSDNFLFWMSNPE